MLHHWRKPEHEEFCGRNGWSLWNAFTEVFKTVNPHTALRRGEALHGLFDAEDGRGSGGIAAGDVSASKRCASPCGDAWAEKACLHVGGVFYLSVE